jgi:hypothetical protein
VLPGSLELVFSSHRLFGVLSQLDKYGLKILYCSFQLNNCLPCVDCWLEERLAIFFALVLEPGDIETVVALGDEPARELAKLAVFTSILALLERIRAP